MMFHIDGMGDTEGCLSVVQDFLLDDHESGYFDFTNYSDEQWNIAFRTFKDAMSHGFNTELDGETQLFSEDEIQDIRMKKVIPFTDLTTTWKAHMSVDFVREVVERAGTHGIAASRRFDQFLGVSENSYLAKHMAKHFFLWDGGNLRLNPNLIVTAGDETLINNATIPEVVFTLTWRKYKEKFAGFRDRSLSDDYQIMYDIRCECALPRITNEKRMSIAAKANSSEAELKIFGKKLVELFENAIKINKEAR